METGPNTRDRYLLYNYLQLPGLLGNETERREGKERTKMRRTEVLMQRLGLISALC